MEFSNYLLPEEAGEMTLAQVTKLRQLERALRDLFKAQDYKEVMPASFEYVDLYKRLDAGFIQEKMFQFINHEGQSITLRYDFTIPLVRTYALSGQSEIARYAYYGKVFRKERRHKGRRTESYQIGVELLGGAGEGADEEVLQLAQSTLQALPLKYTLLELGSADFFHRLCQLVGNQADSLTELLAKKNLSALSQFVEKNDFSPELKALLLALPVTEDLPTLSQLATDTGDAQLMDAVTYLAQIYVNLSGGSPVSIDLGMVPEMRYYRGLMFKAYSDAVAQPILTGGRYDGLLESFGLATGAIGFCCQVDNVLKALENEEGRVRSDA